MKERILTLSLVASLLVPIPALALGDNSNQDDPRLRRRFFRSAMRLPICVPYANSPRQGSPVWIT